MNQIQERWNIVTTWDIPQKKKKKKKKGVQSNLNKGVKEICY